MPQITIKESEANMNSPRDMESHINMVSNNKNLDQSNLNDINQEDEDIIV